MSTSTFPSTIGALSACLVAVAPPTLVAATTPDPSVGRSGITAGVTAGVTSGSIANGVWVPAMSAPAAPPAAPGVGGQDEVGWLEAVLASDGSEPAIRQGAAERLLALGHERAIEVLARGLNGQDPAVAGAILAAMQAADAVPAALLESVVGALSTLPPDQRELVFPVLSRYRESAIPRLSAIVEDPTRPAAVRASAVSALGSIRSRDAAVVLIGVLDPGRTEPPEVIEAACAALSRLTGLQYGNDVTLWRSWWSQYRDKPLDELLQVMVSSLTTQLADRQTQVDRLTRERDDVAGRLTQIYGELFLTLTPQQRQERVAVLLEDDLETLREFALTAVDRMIRNGEAPGDAVQQALLAGLTDPASSVRGRSLRLLDDLASPLLPQAFGKPFEDETDATVLTAYLDVLTRRPTTVAFPRLVALLATPDVSASAARAIFRLRDEGSLPVGWEADVAPLALECFQRERSPEFVRLLGISIDRSELSTVRELLDEEDDQLRRAAAEALRRRGDRDALLTRLDDSVIFPVAVRALADPPAGIPELQSLATMRPNAEQHAEWSASVGRLVDQLDWLDLIAADDVLAELPETERRQRLVPLRRLAAAPVDAVTRESRRTAVGRLADLLLELGDAAEAVTLLTQADLPPDPELTELRFRATALAGEYDEAAAIREAPEGWVELLTWSLARPAIDPSALRDEIARRFEDRLEGATRTAFEAASTTLTERGGERQGNGQVSGDRTGRVRAGEE